MTASMHEPLDVLVVSDDRHLLRTLSDILRKCGYTPRTATRGHEGISVAEAEAPPAIALVDLMLPDMDGMEVVSRLRERSLDTEIVVLTGNASIESAVGALRQHTYDYLIKPVAPDQLLVTLGRAGDRWLGRRAEHALRQSEERFRRLIESIGDIVFLVDPDLRVSYASPSVTRVLGHPVAEVVGRSVFDLFETADEGGSILQGLHGALAGTPIELTSRHPDGPRVLEVSVNDLRDNPSLRGLVLTARDITGQRKLERQAMQAHRLDSVGRLAGGLAHDFNNLLCVVLGSTELAMIDPGISPNVRDHLGAVKLAGEKASMLTRQLLQFARRQPGEPRVLYLRTMVQDLLPMLRRLLTENVEIVLEFGSEATPVAADPTQLEQVLLNLAVNARDAMPEGGRLTIEVRRVRLEGELAARHAQLGAGDYVLLGVQDEGAGMDDEVRARAIEPFFTTKEQGRGTGLGLSICYGIVRQAHGSLSLHCAPGRGTLVEVLLPVAEAAPEAPVAKSAGELLPRGGETVLVVEDDAGIRAVVVSMLECLGYSVVTASTGREAVELLRRAQPAVHVVLTDVVMPQMSGPELVDRLRAVRPDVKVLFMSGYPHRARDGGSALSAPLICKPFTSTGLARAVRSTLDGGGWRPEGQDGASA